MKQLLRMDQNTADKVLKVLSAASVAAGVAAVGVRLAQFVAESGVSYALDRHPPEFLTKAFTPVRLPSEQREAIENAARAIRALPAERMKLTARDGVYLVGHWIPAERPKRIILAFHGWHSAWDWDFSAIAPFWREQGCSVLYAEQRAQGESGGEVLGYGLLERWDVLDWLDKLNAEGKTGDLPVYLAGVSMGATSVMMAAGQPLPENVRGILADCGFTSAPDMWERVWGQMQPIPYALWRRRVERLGAQRLGVPIDAESTPEALRRSTLPLLLVHGLADSFVPPEMSERNAAANGGPVKTLFVPGAKHGMSYLTDPEAYQAALREFWEACEA